MIRRTKMFLWTGLVILACFTIGQTVSANCGWIVVVNTDNNPGTGPGTQPGTQPGTNPGPDFFDGLDNDDADVTPFGDGGWQNGVAKARYFSEPRQNAVIAWNGESQILVLETDIQSAKETIALEVLPLPGRPTANVKEGDKELFQKSMKLVMDKGAKWPRTRERYAAAAIFPDKTIGPHTIFMLELEQGETFPDFVKEVEANVKRIVGSGAVPVISNDVQRMVQGYIKAGFRYFAFDVIRSGTALQKRHALQYQFQSRALYYPLVVSKSGGSDQNTAIQLVVLTDKMLSQFKGLPQEKITSTTSVQITNNEMQGLSPDIANLMGGSVTGRIWKLTGNLNGFPGDIFAR